MEIERESEHFSLKNWFQERFEPGSLGIILLFLIVLGSEVFFVYCLIEGLKSNNWVEHDAIVISSYVESNKDSDGYVMYTAIIQYQYNVNDVIYTSDSITFMDSVSNWYESSSNYRKIKSQVDQYPVGKIITIYYNPDSPAKACIEPGLETWIWVLMPGLLIVLGIMGYIIKKYFIKSL